MNVDRAGLLRAVVGGLPLAEIAHLFGVDPPHPETTVADGSQVRIKTEGAATGASVWPTSAEETPFWRVVAAQGGAKPTVAAARGGTTVADEAREVSVVPQRPSAPCCSVPLLLERLLSAIGAPAPGRHFDVPALVDRFARVAPVDPLPRVMRPRSPDKVEVWVDISPRLAPLRQDQVGLIIRLRVQFGPNVSVRRFWGPHHPVDPPESVEAGVVVLLGDLGMAGRVGEMAAWARWGRRLRAQGKHTVALTAVDAHGLSERVQQAWACVPYEVAPQRAIPTLDSPGVHRLWAACALTHLTQPGLLRDLRFVLAPGLGLAHELMVWAQAAEMRVRPRGSGLPTPRADECGMRIAGLPTPTRLPPTGEAAPAPEPASPPTAECPEKLGQMWAAIRAWHVDLPPELLFAETLDWAVRKLPVPELDLEAARDFGARVLHTLSTGQGAGTADSWADWVRGVATGVLATQPNNDTADARLLRALLVEAERVLTRVPAAPPARWAIRQRGTKLHLRPEPVVEDPATVPNLAPGSPVGAMQVGPTLTLVRDGERGKPMVPTAGMVIPLEGLSELILDGGAEVLTLRTLSRHDDGGWSAMGRDEYGLWAEVDFGGVVQRFRWIPPGRFWMGSPETEQGRYKVEGPRHEVDLTEGFWMGDTPVTQALWTALTGKNPSDFTKEADAPKRPVERVSWEDAQKVLARMNGPVGTGPVFRLPSEAEWERACRAGTEGATWRGELDYADDHKAKAPMLDAIAWYGRNSGSTTHPVGGKEPNPWGLVDMLGNVWEWCQDTGIVPYSKAPRTAVAIEKAGPNRAYRGGSWFSDARSVRAAYRYAFSPGLRIHDLGFRLSRGPAHQSQVPDSLEKVTTNATAHRRAGPDAEPGPDRRGDGAEGKADDAV